jgi:hypothetical protein
MGRMDTSRCAVQSKGIDYACAVEFDGTTNRVANLVEMMGFALIHAQSCTVHQCEHANMRTCECANMRYA